MILLSWLTDLGITTPFVLKTLSAAFFAILFLQSGLDKVFNYKGNLDYFKDHFKNSPLKNMVGLMMPMITLIETLAGLACAIGLVIFFINGDTSIASLGLILSGLSLVMLFFGQRLANDYAGAATITTYFIAALGSIYVWA